MDALAIVHKFYPDVEKVKDATKAITIEVTPKDIKTSQTKSHKTCAIAVACQRKMHLDGVVISRAVAYLIKDNIAIRYLVSNAAAREVIAFDRGGTFEPGEYTLIKPHKAIRINGDRSDVPASRNKKKDRKRREGPRHVTANIRATLDSIR